MATSAIEIGLPRAKHDPHPAAADLFEQFVLAERLRSCRLRGRVRRFRRGPFRREAVEQLDAADAPGQLRMPLDEHTPRDDVAAVQRIEIPLEELEQPRLFRRRHLGSGGTFHIVMLCA